MHRALFEKICVALVFLAILLVGLAVYDDYGISIDEPTQRMHSIVNYRWISWELFSREVLIDSLPYADMDPTDDLSMYKYKYYGVAMQLPLVFAEDCYKHMTGNEMGYRQIYLMRHLYTFLVYYFGLVCFYFLLRHLFNRRPLAIAGVLMVFLFGRFFAQSFYNIKDILFASLMMVSLCCAERVLAAGRKPLWCLLFTLSGALLVTSRIVGALLIVLVLLAMLLQDLLGARRAKRAGADRPKEALKKRLLPYGLICCAYPIWIILTPAAWSDPLGFSLGYITCFSDYTAWAGDVAFAGKLLEVSASAPPPRSFLITWIAMTVPVVNQLLCLLGIGALIARTVSRKHTEDTLTESSLVMLWLMLMFIIGTIGYQFLFQPIVYNGWRHAFYLYPMMIALAVFGLWWIYAQARNHRKRWLAIGVSGVLSLSLAYNAYHIASNHPYEYCLYNTVGRRYAAGFERDYWCLSYLSMAEWLLDNEPGDVLRYYCEETFNGLRFYMLKEGYERLQLCLLEEAQYAFYVPYESNTNDFPIEGFTEIHGVIVDGVKIAAIYERDAK